MTLLLSRSDLERLLEVEACLNECGDPALPLAARAARVYGALPLRGAGVRADLYRQTSDHYSGWGIS